MDEDLQRKIGRGGHGKYADTPTITCDWRKPRTISIKINGLRGEFEPQSSQIREGNSNNNNNNNNKLGEAAELIEDKSPYCKQTPAIVLENENFKLYCNRSILTDKTITFNRPDITFMNKKTKKAF